MKMKPNMNRQGTARLTIAILASAVMAGTVAGATDQPPPGAPAAAVSRYTGVANVPALAGGTTGTALNVEVKDLSFVQTPQGARLAGGAFYIAQLKSGVIDTEIAGRKSHHRPGDIWTVAAGEPMIITLPAHRQAAQLRTVSLAPATSTLR